VAEDTAAARDRVLAARAAFETQLELLEASARDAVDIPAKIKRSPAKAAAVAGGALFLAAKGPQRLVNGARSAIGRPKKDLPDRMLPEEIEKSLRKLGDDGDRVRGLIERDFAEYASKAAASRRTARNLILLSVARPILQSGAQAIAKVMFTPEETRLDERVEAIRERFRERVGLPPLHAGGTAAVTPTPDTPPSPPAAKGPTAG
jgi:hypothetical protein